MIREFVQLVDEQNREIGVMEKMEAHKLGKLHRAVSVILFNSRNQMLLQQRARGKYHSAGLWANTCCTHPRPGENAEAAATRRRKEEMGISCQLTHQFDVVYKASLDNGLTEYEYDHVFYGYSDDFPVPNYNEVYAWKYLSTDHLEGWLHSAPDAFTAWFPLLFDKVKLVV
jgi:isopentenyl-diphosphate delta-isomerase